MFIFLAIVSSSAAFAAEQETLESETLEIEVESAVEEASEAEIEIESETESELETEQENALEQMLYLRSDKDDEVLVQQVTEDETGEDISGVAVVVFWAHQDHEDADVKTKVLLSDEQRDYITRVGRVYPEMLVIFNYCMPDEELYLSADKQISALVLTEEDTIEEIEDAIRKLDIEKARKSYQKEVKKIKKSREESETAVTEVESSTESESDGEFESKIVTGSRYSLNGTSGQSETGLQNNQSNGKKDVTITLIIDEMVEEDEELTATYEVSALKAVTDGTVTITYDKDKMTYVEADESDALEEMNVEIKDAVNGKADEGTIEISFSSEAGVKMNGDLLYLEFALKNKAQKGDSHELKLKVDEMKSGKDDLTAKVVQKSITVIGNSDDGEDESETQSETETKNSETTETKSSESQKNTANATKKSSSPKTGDDTMLLLWTVLGAAAVLVIVSASRSKVK